MGFLQNESLPCLEEPFYHERIDFYEKKEQDTSGDLHNCYADGDCQYADFCVGGA